ncbi:MAG: hypothetical protein KatS3mg031_0338 [Chitinophagales bacterium]|nr:MAG: hypothetical protein KatS3mg031_0338 [Chitinophagales bacterium]
MRNKLSFPFLTEHIILYTAISIFCSLYGVAQPVIGLQEIASGFNRPVDIAHCGDDRLFIVEQAGIIKILNPDGTINPRPFLDIRNKVESGGFEQGLLGLAFHPDYKNNGYFFVNYTDKGPGFGNTVVSRFQVSPSDPDSALASSETILFTIAQPYANHNGGDLNFGPDGYLYIGLGDGGSANDPGNRAQNPMDLLGKILRIDVNSIAGYRIPPDNPFVNDTTTRDEIWALGLRNPWRFSFDRLTGDMWIGDVGQNAREEVNFQPASSMGGENYGWRCYEGTRPNNTTGCASAASYVAPVYEYVNPTFGCSVIGGYVYRGCRYPNLFGHYIFSDYCSGRFWSTVYSGGNWVTYDQGTFANSFTTFGEDRHGELYVAGSSGGRIYRITESLPVNLPVVQVSGSTTFCAGDSATLSAQSGFAVYTWLKDGLPVDTGLSYSVTTAGEYALQITGTNGCKYTTPSVSISVHPSPEPVITLSDTDFCTGDSVTLDAGNWVAYLWSDGDTLSPRSATAGGTYSITVTDTRGCTGTAAATIDEHPLPQPFLSITQDTTICAGSSLLLFTIDDFTAYSWSSGDTLPAIIVRDSGTYSVTVTDSYGCVGVSDKVEISVAPAPPVAVIVFENNQLMVNDSGFTYQWYVNGDLIPGATGSGLVPPVSGEYTIVLTNAAGCSTLSEPLQVIINGLSSLWIDQIQLAPNPFESELWVTTTSIPAENLTIGLYTLTGQPLPFKISEISNQQVLLYIPEQLMAGTYILLLQYGCTQKLFKVLKM